VLPPYPSELSQEAVRSLEKLGVEVRTGVQVTELKGSEVRLRDGEREETIRAQTVLWAAGMRASPLGAALARRAGAELDRGGRVVVQPDLSLPGYPDVYVIGDLACFAPAGAKPLPGVAPVAIQQGRFVAERLKGNRAERFSYHDKGSLAVIGRNAAVAAFGRWRFHGFLAWLTWMFIHLLYLVEFDNQAMVLFQWARSYFTRNRGARLITATGAPTDGETERGAARPVDLATA
jgi:NADH dehydrogenase